LEVTCGPLDPSTDSVVPDGGGFNSGVGSSASTDGGNLASREDIVVVSFNYRLSTLGFLAIPGTNITGNYGIGSLHCSRRLTTLRASAVTRIRLPSLALLPVEAQSVSYLARHQKLGSSKPALPKATLEVELI